MKSLSIRSHASLRRQNGISLIIVMIMVVIIGLTSAAAIRNATSGERATNNIRLQNLAQQYAEAALRYCEAQVMKPDADRVATLKEAAILPAIPVYAAASLWDQTVTWTGSGGASASRTSLPQSQIKSSASSVTPTTMPQCVAERQKMAGGEVVYVVTARGFSPGYTANSSTGATTNGSVVWLQSTLLLQ